MNITKANNLVCPIDGEKLEQTNGQFVCDNGHTFDVARQGYVNLLPVQHKRSKQPGDSKAMVLARRHFLNTGVYLQIASKLSEIVVDHIINDTDLKDTGTTDNGINDNTACILDAGCGEGYYFDILLGELSDAVGNKSLSLVGLDISKDAILQAAKRNHEITWLVGTNRQPPLKNASVDVILCVFGFLSAEGFARVLKPGGKIILIDPGAEHLSELREVIYPELKVKQTSVSAHDNLPEFSLLSKENLRFKVKLESNEKINNLLLMTPHFYRASKVGREVACNLQNLEITVDVVFSVLQKN